MRRLVLCCDGTWNSADQKVEGEPCPTNVLRKAFRVAKSAGATAQITYYDQGVGTGNWLDKFSGGAFGEGLEENIHDAYRFLIANYKPGDEIFLFGFSRGAFTARSVGGMIRKCGIAKRDSVKTYLSATELYRNDEHPDDPGPKAFRAAHSLVGDKPIKVKFIGVWDTVGALGIPLGPWRALNKQKFQFHDTELSGSVEQAYHALAIDERRKTFEPTLWSYKPKPGQKVEQAWFCGVHSDVGGGYKERQLSDIALLWMLEKARRAGLAADLTADTLNPPQPDPLAPTHNSMTWSYALLGQADRPIGLSKAVGKPDEPPSIPDPTQFVHESVLKRWDADPGYRPPQLKEYFRRTGNPRGL